MSKITAPTCGNNTFDLISSVLTAKGKPIIAGSVPSQKANMTLAPDKDESCAIATVRFAYSHPQGSNVDIAPIKKAFCTGDWDFVAFKNAAFIGENNLKNLSFNRLLRKRAAMVETLKIKSVAISAVAIHSTCAFAINWLNVVPTYAAIKPNKIYVTSLPMLYAATKPPRIPNVDDLPMVGTMSPAANVTNPPHMPMQ